MPVEITILNATVNLTGELTFINARTLWHAGMQLFRNNNALMSQIDLTQVIKVDSAGLAVMLEWQRLAGGTLAFVAIPRDLELIAQVAGVYSLFKPQTSAR